MSAAAIVVWSIVVVVLTAAFILAGWQLVRHDHAAAEAEEAFRQEWLKKRREAVARIDAEQQALQTRNRERAKAAPTVGDLLESITRAQHQARTEGEE